MKDSNDIENKSSKAIANQPAQLQSRGAALAPPSPARSTVSPPSANQEVVQKQLDLDAELLVLGGQLSFGSKFKGLFGSETSFSKIEKLVKEYSSKKTPATKQAIITECNAWLNSDSRRSVKEGDDVKKASITRIRDGLKNDAAGAIDLTILSDKVTTTNRIKETITGEKSTYQLIEIAYLDYQQKFASYDLTITSLHTILAEVQKVENLIDLWKSKHPEEFASAKGKEVIKMEAHLGALSFNINISDKLSVIIKRIKLSEVKKGNFAAEYAEIRLKAFDTTLEGSVVDPSISSNGINWDTATFSLSELTIGTVSMSDLGGSIKGKSQNYEYTLSAKKFAASVAEKLDVSGTEIAYDSAAEKFTASEAEVKIAFFNTEVTGTVTNLKASSTEGLDWEKASLAASEINVMAVNIKDLKGEISGKAEEYAYTISAGSFGANIDNLVNASGDEIVYNSAKKELEAKSANVDLTVLGETVSGELVGPKVNSEGIDWETATLTLPDIKLGMINIEGLTGTLGGKKVGYTYTVSASSFDGEVAGISYSGSEVVYDSITGELSAASAGAEFSLFDKTITGKITKPVISTNSVDWEKASISVDSLSYGGFEAKGLTGELGNKSTEYNYTLSAESFTGSLLGLSFTGTEIAYDRKAGEFSAKSASAGINMLGNTVTGTINDLVSSQEKGFDWSTAELKADPGVISFGDNLNFTLPNIIINGKKENYLLLANDAKASLTIGELINAEGTGSLSWDFVGGKTPEIEKAEIDVSINSVKSMPGAFLPDGIWPFSISFEFPVAPGAYAGFGFEVGGGIAFAAKGKVIYTKPNKLIFDIEGGPEGFVDFSVFANAGAGHPVVVALEAELKATIKAIAHAKTSIKGEATKEGDSYKLNELMAKYNLIAELKAAISFNLNARALYIFKKTLYEIKLTEWDLGKGATSGEFSLINNQGAIGDPSTFMNKPNSPFISEQSEYMKNLAVFNEEIEPRQNTAAAIQETKNFMNEDKIAKEEAILAKFNLAKAIITATPQELLKRKTVLAELKRIKESQWFIREVNREKRLKQYEDISSRISNLEVELENIQEAIKNGLEPGLTNDIAPSIKQLFVNLNTMTLAFDDADKYKRLEQGT